MMPLPGHPPPRANFASLKPDGPCALAKAVVVFVHAVESVTVTRACEEVGFEASDNLVLLRLYAPTGVSYPRVEISL